MWHQDTCSRTKLCGHTGNAFFAYLSLSRALLPVNQKESASISSFLPPSCSWGFGHWSGDMGDAGSCGPEGWGRGAVWSPGSVSLSCDADESIERVSLVLGCEAFHFFMAFITFLFFYPPLASHSSERKSRCPEDLVVWLVCAWFVQGAAELGGGKWVTMTCSSETFYSEMR